MIELERIESNDVGDFFRLLADYAERMANNPETIQVVKEKLNYLNASDDEATIAAVMAYLAARFEYRLEPAGVERFRIDVANIVASDSKFVGDCDDAAFLCTVVFAILAHAWARDWTPLLAFVSYKPSKVLHHAVCYLRVPWSTNPLALDLARSHDETYPITESISQAIISRV